MSEEDNKTCVLFIPSYFQAILSLKKEICTHCIQNFVDPGIGWF